MEIIKPSEDSKLLNLILVNKDEAYKHLTSSGYIDEWAEWNDLYHSIPERKPYDWMSNRFLPFTMSQVETALTMMASLLFSIDPPFEVRPRERGDEIQSEIIQLLLGYQFKETDVEFKFHNFLRELLIYGTAIGKVYWDTRTISKKVRVQEFEPILNLFGLKVGQRHMGVRTEKRDYITFDGPTFEICPLLDIFVDPQAEDVESAGWIIHRTRKTLGHIKSLQRQGVYNNEVDKLKDSDAIEYQEAKKELESNEQRVYEPEVTRPPGTGLIELLEWYGEYDYDGDGIPEPCLFTTAAGKHIIRKGETPFYHGKKPFIKGTYICLPHYFYGIGIPEILRDIQHNLNETVNQRNDNLSFALNRPARYKKGAGVKTSGLIFKPGGIYGADENDAIVWEVIPDVTRSSFAHAEDLKNWGQEATAITKLTLGMGGAEFGRTARGMAMLQGASGKRLAIYTKMIEDMAFRKLIEFFYQLDYQFMDKEKVIRIVGEKGVEFMTVSPEDIQKDYDFIPSGVFTMEDKNEKALKLIQFLNLFKNSPIINVQAIMKKLYKLLEIGNNPDEILNPPEQMEQEQARQAVMAILQQQQKGQGKPTEGQGVSGGPGIPAVGGEIGGVPSVPVGGMELPPEMQMPGVGI